MGRTVPLALVLLTALASPVRAQNPDFLFGKPRGTIAFRSGWLFARAGSDLFTFVQDQLTVDKNDFNAPALGMDVDVPVRGRLSAVVGFELPVDSLGQLARGSRDATGLGDCHKGTQL